MTNLNDVLNAVMSIQLPFAIIPALCFSSSRIVMGEFRSIPLPFFNEIPLLNGWCHEIWKSLVKTYGTRLILGLYCTIQYLTAHTYT